MNDIKELNDEELEKVSGGENNEMTHDDFYQKKCLSYSQSSNILGLSFAPTCNTCQYGLESGEKYYCTIGKIPTEYGIK